MAEIPRKAYLYVKCNLLYDNKMLIFFLNFIISDDKKRKLNSSLFSVKKVLIVNTIMWFVPKLATKY
jgi:hypothetical protein